MNVYIISGTFPELRCGVGDYTYWLCSELRKYNIILNVITSQSHKIKPLEGVNIIQLVKDWSFLRLFTFLKFFRKNVAGIIHIQYPTQSYKNKAMINILAIFLKFFVPKNVLIVTIHDMATAHIFNRLRAIPFLFFADKIILTVKEEKEYLVKKIPFLQPKLEIIAIGSNIKPTKISSEERVKIRKELGVGDDEMLLSHFGYILSKKGVETLLYSLKCLQEEGEKVKLIFISDFCPQTNNYHFRLKSLVQSLGLGNFVIWSGYCVPKEVSRYLLSSDISIQLYPDGVSYRRTSFLAALCHGLPIITTVDKKLPEGLKDRENILAVKPNDIKGIAKAIKELVASLELRKKIAANAEQFSKKFFLDDFAKKHFELYQELMIKKECWGE